MAMFKLVYWCIFKLNTSLLALGRGIPSHDYILRAHIKERTLLKNVIANMISQVFEVNKSKPLVP